MDSTEINELIITAKKEKDEFTEFLQRAFRLAEMLDKFKTMSAEELDNILPIERSNWEKLCEDAKTVFNPAKFEVAENLIKVSVEIATQDAKLEAIKKQILDV